uniref:Ig-like domain-containing protein n=1 Tax=Megaselia scalaris TaxID=36166 RepID=T1GU24_MEGSC
MKIFQIPGTKVVRHSSNESQVTLDSVQMATSGKYSCEVSADAPSFHTLISAGELDVV